MPRPRKWEWYRITSFYIPKEYSDLEKKMKEICFREKTTRNNLILTALVEYVNQHYEENLEKLDKRYVISGGSESKSSSKPLSCINGNGKPQPLQNSGTGSNVEQSAPLVKLKPCSSVESSTRLGMREKKSLLEAGRPIRESAQNQKESF